MPSILRSLVDNPRDDRPSYLDRRDESILRGRLDSLIDEKRVRNVPVLKPFFRSMYPGQIVEEWFLDVETNEIYGFVHSGERFDAFWYKVDALTPDEEKKGELFGGLVERGEAGFLASVHGGRQDHGEVNLIRWFLERWIADQKVAAIEPKEPPQKPTIHEEWYEDLTTGAIFKLVHDLERDEFRWEKVIGFESPLQ